MSASSDELYALKLTPGKFVVVDVNPYTDPTDPHPSYRLYKIHSIDYDTCELIEYDPPTPPSESQARSQSSSQDMNSKPIERHTYQRIAIPMKPSTYPPDSPIYALWPMSYAPENPALFTTDLTTEYYVGRISSLKMKTPLQNKIKARWVAFNTGETIPVPLETLFDNQTIPALMQPLPVTRNMVRAAIQNLRNAERLKHMAQQGTPSSSLPPQRVSTPVTATGGSSSSSLSTLKRKAESHAIQRTTAAATTQQQAQDIPAVKRQAITPTVTSTTSSTSSTSTSSTIRALTITPSSRSGLITPLPPSAFLTSSTTSASASASTSLSAAASPAHPSTLQQPLYTAEQQERMNQLKLEKQKEKKSWRVEWPATITPMTQQGGDDKHKEENHDRVISMQDEINELMKLSAKGKHLRDDTPSDQPYNSSTHYISLLGNLHEWVAPKVLIPSKIIVPPYVSNFS